MVPRRSTAGHVLLLSILSVAGVLAIARDARSQGTTGGQPLGRIYFSAEPTNYYPFIEAASFVPSHVYLVAEIDYGDIGRPELDATVGIQAWEADVDIPGLGEDFVITSAIVRNEALNLGDSTNFIVGLSPPVLASETPIDLVDYTILMPLAAPVEEVWLWVGPAKPTSFDPPTPGFYDSGEVGECEVIATGSPRPCLRPFARTYYAVINCTYSCILDPVAEETWSRIKARY